MREWTKLPGGSLHDGLPSRSIRLFWSLQDSYDRPTKLRNLWRELFGNDSVYERILHFDLHAGNARLSNASLGKAQNYCGIGEYIEPAILFLGSGRYLFDHPPFFLAGERPSRRHRRKRG